MNEKQRLRELDNARKKRHFEKKLLNAPWVDCNCGCGEKIKSVDAYGRPKQFVNGHSNRKYDDPLEYKRVYGRKRHKDPVLKAREQEKKQKYHHERKAKLILHLGGKCLECGLVYNGQNAAVFQFHHRNPSEKQGRIEFWWAWARILEEAAKCNLVCANCHHLIHGGSY